MRSGTLFAIAIVCVAISSCGAPGIKPYYIQNRPVYVQNILVTNARCDTPNCSLTVTVNDCANGDIKVTDANGNGPDLDMSAGTGQRSVTWKIATPGYEFPKDPFKYGIWIKSDTYDEFKNSQVTGNGDTLTIQYTKDGPGKHYYTYGLQLRSTTGSKPYCALLDPWMIG